ncbi:MAG: YHYH protein [Actinomycetota bacterium]
MLPPPADSAVAAGRRPRPLFVRLAAVAATLALIAAACGSDDDATDTTGADDGSASLQNDGSGTTETDDDTTVTASSGASCAEVAASFVAGPSANPDLPDPESSAVCEGGSVIVTANGIPDYTYIETSPGPPDAQDYTFTIPADPAAAAATTSVPLVGPLGVTLAGVPIYGPTEGTGGDVESIEGILMACGSHNGPTGFHLHLLGTSDTTDCDFSPEEVASGPQLLGYAFDGFPIYTGNDQYESSWELTDASLFATDTWSAHTHVDGSGDLDECNGRIDEDGNYAYYTTDAFPYVLGCFVGEVDLTDAGGGGGTGPGGEGQGPPPDGDGQGPGGDG